MWGMERVWDVYVEGGECGVCVGVYGGVCVWGDVWSMCVGCVWGYVRGRCGGVWVCVQCVWDVCVEGCECGGRVEGCMAGCVEGCVGYGVCVGVYVGCMRGVGVWGGV